MKIALLYSGNFRTFNYCFENHFDFFKTISNDVDIYFSTWDKISYSKTLNDKRHFFSENKFLEDTIVDIDLIKSVINNRFNLKNVNIEKYENVNFENFKLKSKWSQGLLYQYYKIKDSFSMINNDYDFIFRLRTDVILKNKINIDIIKNAIENDKIIFNKIVWSEHSFNGGFINEMFWGANFNNMKKACKIFDNYQNIENLIFTTDNDPKGLSVYGERFVMKI